MPRKERILLGFEIGTGEPVYIEPSHLVITGLSRKSGKTTALEAIAARSRATMLVFKTKPGEEVYAGARTVMPYFKEKSDWSYVEALLEALLKERQKYNRYWIIESCRGSKTLADVDRNITAYFRDKKARPDSDKYQAYTLLHEYFKMVLPILERMTFSRDFPALEEGINVMDLSEMEPEVQSLIIESCLAWILKNGREIITQLSECWKFVPEGRKTPVTWTLMSLIRQGAVRGNYIAIDSQDITGISKAPLKQVSTWILGVQSERNEVKHTIEQIPLPKSKRPAPDEIMSLKLGHFILATADEVRRLYVQPTWLSEDEARRVALGEVNVKDVDRREEEEDWSDVMSRIEKIEAYVS